MPLTNTFLSFYEMWEGHSFLRNIAKMYIELNKKEIFYWILNKKGTLCHETSLNQIYRNVLESKQGMRQLPILTQTFVPDIAARWKMRKCTGRRLKCWIQTKIFIKYQHLLNIICKTYDCLLSFKAFIHFACLFYNTETVSQMRHLLSWFWSHLNLEVWIFV